MTYNLVNDEFRDHHGIHWALLIEGLMASSNRQHAQKTDLHAEGYSAPNKLRSTTLEMNLTMSSHCYEDHLAMEFAEGINPPLNPFGPAGRQETWELHKSC
jgi:hypothetical protein